MTGDAMPKHVAGGDFHKNFTFSPAVLTEGGRIVWLAGAIALRDEGGKDLTGDFGAQVDAVFRNMDRQLKSSGGQLSDLVTMTVYVTDAASVPRLVESRKKFFPNERYPASTLIAGCGFALPGILIEIQGIAVIGDKLTDG
jgi:2-iminobutanoate/2-iminopropanoate deaminase